MVRKLKFHEKKLLKKVDFISWNIDNNLHEIKMMKRFHIQKREDYTMYNKLSRQVKDLVRKIKELNEKDPLRLEATTQVLDNISQKIFRYNKLSRQVRDLVRKIKELDEKDPFRLEATNQVLEKLYNLGLIVTKSSLAQADTVNASSFCRRRLPVLMVRSNMAENLKAATTFIEQGHVRVGPEVITDPAFLVTRNMGDFITWTDTSAIRKHVLDYNDIRDDFDLFG